MTRHFSSLLDAIPSSNAVLKTPKETFPPPTILPATEQDIPALARIHVTALSPNLLFRLCWPNQTRQYEAVCAGLESVFKTPEFEWWFVKAVNEEGTIMGWGAWTVRPADLGSRDSSGTLSFLFPGLMDGVNGSSDEEEGKIDDVEDFPSIPGLPDYMHSHTQVILDDWLLGKKHVLLNSLFVAPTFQRRGVGTAILR
ncbi:uncharacterized protein LY89DRAFT_140398 [Mollisia scopiformis]|uniref:Uncharacterized protein n=1 Tax=Mollisia scopiformis TaxID=149040 RepID=A0A194X2Q8_MOLSC|nr:uncharacterized protein LY89DRAFT_140398 [Mollisia scopiformis]KUJ14463.1 hypothetical protein LY89DRAFT_140398 [Mollisia scopiformis]